MWIISKGFDEYFGNTLRCPDNRDVDHLIPERFDSTKGQDDRPDVQYKDFDSSWNALPFIHDETVPEDDLGTDQTLCGVTEYSHQSVMEDQKVIQKYFSRIEKELDVRSISGDLFSAEVLGFDQKQEIDSKNTSKAANTVLATYLHQNADSAKLEGFLTVLESDQMHPKHRKLAKDMRTYLAQALVGISMLFMYILAWSS